MRINKKDFTHYASFYGIPCYINTTDDDCPTLAGRNRLYDALLPVVTFIHNYFIQPFFACGFPIRVGVEIEKDNQ
jgi:hypothetical protein